MNTDNTHIIVTSPRLSRKLLAAGYDITTAEHRYWIPWNPQTRQPGKPRFRRGPVTTLKPTDKGREIPAWSCGSLAALARTVLGDEPVDEILSNFDGTADNERQTIDAIGALLTAHKQTTRTEASKKPIRENWPVDKNDEKKNHTPFRKQFATWWSQRPWARKR